MLKNPKKYYEQNLGNLSVWAQKKIFGLFVFNLIVMLLIVLRSAGYFEPFFPITINFIVFISLTMAVFLLHVKSGALFIISFVFWVLAAFLRIVSIEVWAERAALYTFQALIIGVILFIIESVLIKKQDMNKPNE